MTDPVRGPFYANTGPIDGPDRCVENFVTTGFFDTPERRRRVFGRLHEFRDALADQRKPVARASGPVRGRWERIAID